MQRVVKTTTYILVCVLLLTFKLYFLIAFWFPYHISYFLLEVRLVWIVSLFSFGWAHQGQLGSPWAFLPPHCALFAPAQAIHSVASKTLILASIMVDLSIDRSHRHHLFRVTQVQYLEVLLHKPVQNLYFIPSLCLVLFYLFIFDKVFGDLYSRSIIRALVQQKRGHIIW